MFPGMKGGMLFFDPQEGNFYRHDVITQNLKCCSQQILNFYQSRYEKKYKSYSQELCKSSPGMEHDHAIPCRSSVEFSTFYWACQLYLAQQAVEKNVNPITVIAHVASTWPFQLPDFVVNPLVNVLLVSTMKHFCSLVYPFKEQFRNSFGNKHLTKLINYLETKQPRLPCPINPGEFCYFSTENPFLTFFVLTEVRPKYSNGDGSLAEKADASEGEIFAFNLKCLVIILKFIVFSLVENVNRSVRDVHHLNLNTRKRMLDDTDESEHQPPPTFVSSSCVKSSGTLVNQLPHDSKKNSEVVEKSSAGKFCN